MNGLQGNLLLVHGGGDDNVHFQNSEILINALVAANKPFQMMEYPNRTHCICQGRNTKLHLFSLITRYLDQNLLATPAVPLASARPPVGDERRSRCGSARPRPTLGVPPAWGLP